MKIFLVGSTGYVGEKILEDLLNTKHHTRVLVRKRFDSINIKNQLEKIEIVEGDITQPDSLSQKLEGCDSVIFLPGLIREFPNKGITFEKIHYVGLKNVVDEARQAGVQRFILMSANGVRPYAHAKYLQTKYKAELYLQNSTLDWTIFRPSVIFGGNSKKQNFISVISKLIDKSPVVIPIIGSGNYRFQPVALQNVSEAFVKSLEMPQTIRKVYHLCGLEVFTYNQLVDIISKFIKCKNKPKLHISAILIKSIAWVFDRYKWFPVTREQITMMMEENICKENQSFFDEFNIEPILFSEYYK